MYIYILYMYISIIICVCVAPPPDPRLNNITSTCYRSGPGRVVIHNSSFHEMAKQSQV